jgi:NADPH:quinone reductase-like Zn-dependent oxidoreductase
MKAVRYDRYGSANVLQLQEVDQPVTGDDDLLVRVQAVALNPLDLYYLRGLPYILRTQTGLTRPKAHGLGADMAGTVEAVGRNVTTFQPGDEVFGSGSQMLAEYVRIDAAKAVVHKPARLTFEQAAAVPVAALTALQALRDKGQVQPGHRVLVNGASGGVGSFAVQIAKALGAEVTGVTSTANVDMVSSLGADHVIDYTKADFTLLGQRYDLLIDVAGSRTLSSCWRLLEPAGVLVAVGSPSKGRWIGPMIRPVKIVMLAPLVRRKMTFFVADLSRDDLVVLCGLLGSGKVTPVIDRTYPMAEVADAVRYLGTGHARGKVVVTIGQDAR